MITPFKKDLTVDVPALKRLTEHLVEGGADYLVVMGTTGETSTLDKEDRKLVLDTVIATIGHRDSYCGRQKTYSAWLGWQQYFRAVQSIGQIRHYRADGTSFSGSLLYQAKSEWLL